MDTLEELVASRQAFARERERLMTALWDYGRHGVGCLGEGTGEMPDESLCVCGLAAARGKDDPR